MITRGRWIQMSVILAAGATGRETCIPAKIIPMGNPATAEIPRLVEELVVYGPEGGSKIVSLAGGSISLGRAVSNDLSYPDDSGLSRQHFIIERVGSDFVLKDLGSKNGTELNSQRVSGSTVLHPGDRIKAGRLTIEYRKGDSRPTNQTVLFVESPQSDTSSGTVIATSLQAVLGTQESKRVATPVDALIRAGRELAAHRPLSELFPLILDLS